MLLMLILAILELLIEKQISYANQPAIENKQNKCTGEHDFSIQKIYMVSSISNLTIFELTCW
jgi:hypothetical protein